MKESRRNAGVAWKENFFNTGARSVTRQWLKNVAQIADSKPAK